MTPEEVHRAATERAAVILERIAGQPVALVPLSDYPTAEDFRKVLGSNPGWSWREWRQVNSEVADLLRARGVVVSLVPLAARDYFDWLLRHSLSNSPTARAQYVATYAGPWPEPLPLPDKVAHN